MISFQPESSVSLPEDRRKLVTRLVVAQYLVIAGFAALALAFWYFQVVEHERFRELAENNHQRQIGLRAPRGVIFDRDGTVLVENRDSFVISLVREHSRDVDRTIRLLARVVAVDESTVRDAIRRHRSEPLYRPVPIVEDATLAQVAAVAARRFELPEVLVERVPARRYPADAMAAHLFGYVSEATETQLAKEGLRAGDVVGQAGFEKVYNPLLMGVDGARRVVVNSVGREIRTLEEVAPAGGRRVQLTIDADLQRATEAAFKAMSYAGAAVVLDPNSGEVLSYASLPSYDPNAFAAGIDRATWAALNTDALKPLQDRAIQGRYSPGSTFKMAVAAAALEEGITTPDFTVTCHGGKDFYGRVFQCWNKNGHGTVDLRHAIEQSCDVYFYTLGKMVGVDSDPQVGDAARPRRQDRHRPAERGGGTRSVERVEAAEAQGAVVPGRDHLGGDRAGTGVGDARFDGCLHGGARQRRPHGDAAPAQGCGRGQWMEGGARVAGAGAGKPQARDDGRNPRRALDGRERGRHGRQRQGGGPRRVGQDGHGAGDLARGGEAVPGPDDTGPARQRVVRVLRAARQPADRGGRLRRARRARQQRGADHPAHPRDVLREEGRAAGARIQAADAAGAETCGRDRDAGGAGTVKAGSWELAAGSGSADHA